MTQRETIPLAGVKPVVIDRGRNHNDPNALLIGKAERAAEIGNVATAHQMHGRGHDSRPVTMSYQAYRTFWRNLCDELREIKPVVRSFATQARDIDSWQHDELA